VYGVAEHPAKRIEKAETTRKRFIDDTPLKGINPASLLAYSVLQKSIAMYWLLDNAIDSWMRINNV
jgi:hypothetical protein